MNRRGKVVLLLLAVGIAFSCLSLSAKSAEPTGWHTIKWPFPADAWPDGRAFHCGREACGMELDFYIRPKIGFCDCYRGVADDDEIDRVGDLVMLSENYTPSAPGISVNLGGIAGRARHFVAAGPNRMKLYAIGIALSRKCDAIVATVVGDRPISESAEASAFNLLDSEEIKNWIATIPQS